jgi:uncharacterized CHY-type Zn-finger protein
MEAVFILILIIGGIGISALIHYLIIKIVKIFFAYKCKQYIKKHNLKNVNSKEKQDTKIVLSGTLTDYNEKQNLTQYNVGTYRTKNGRFASKKKNGLRNV